MYYYTIPTYPHKVVICVTFPRLLLIANIPEMSNKHFGMCISMR